MSEVLVWRAARPVVWIIWAVVGVILEGWAVTTVELIVVPFEAVVITQVIWVGV